MRDYANWVMTFDNAHAQYVVKNFLQALDDLLPLYLICLVSIEMTRTGLDTGQTSNANMMSLGP